MLPNKFNVSDGLFCLGLVLQIFCCNFPSRKAGEGLPKQRLKCFLLAAIISTTPGGRTLNRRTNLADNNLGYRYLAILILILKICC
jgi:hypothetical protein